MDRINKIKVIGEGKGRVLLGSTNLINHSNPIQNFVNSAIPSDLPRSFYLWPGRTREELLSWLGEPLEVIFSRMLRVYWS